MTLIEMKHVKRAIPSDNFTLVLQFESGEIRFLDMKPFTSGGVWAELRDPKMFNTVKVDKMGGLEWKNGLNYCPDSAFLKSTELPEWILEAMVEAYDDTRRKQREDAA